MAVSVTDIGAAGDTPNPTVAISSVTVPAGSLIVIFIEEAIATVGGTVSDGSNTYTKAASKSQAGVVFGAFYYAWNSLALSGATITYTKENSGVATTMAAFYATGIQTASDPLDAAVTATAGGVSATPSVTSGTPGTSGELFVGCTGRNAGAETFTQDSTNGSYAAPPDAFAIAVSGVGGGFLVNAGSSAKTYAPTISSSRTWVDIIIGFKAAAAAVAGNTLFPQQLIRFM